MTLSLLKPMTDRMLSILSGFSANFWDRSRRREVAGVIVFALFTDGTSEFVSQGALDDQDVLDAVKTAAYERAKAPH